MYRNQAGHWAMLAVTPDHSMPSELSIIAVEPYDRLAVSGMTKQD